MSISDIPTLSLAIALTCVSVLLYSLLSRRSIPASLPPGPKGWPIVGNVTDLPKSLPWVTFAEWGTKYGGIMHVSAFGKSIVILNDAQYALDMFNKKGRTYCDRPTFIMAGDLVGLSDGPALIRFGDTWSQYRRMFAQLMGTRSKILAIEDVIRSETRDFLKRTLSNPSSWAEHGQRYAGGSMLKLVYGYKMMEKDDPFVKLIAELMGQFSEMTASGAYLVDVLPMLRHVPEWLPGAGWKKKIPKYRKTVTDVLNATYNFTKDQIDRGTARPSFLSNLLDGRQFTAEEEMTIKWAALGFYSGAAETTAASIEFFFLALTLHSDEQQRAQAELDKVIGTGRLPTLADREGLPYVNGLFLECLRFYPFVPLGLPHVAVEDDIHDGYFIPKGSIVIPNIWQFFKDPKTYTEPGKFFPERFIASEGHAAELDPREYIFGFGRRACPGLHLGDASMWLLFASVLAVFDVRPPVKDNRPLLPSGKCTDGTISHPESFECVIQPRSVAAEALIQAPHNLTD